MHIAHPEAAQLVGHDLAWGQDPVEIAVQFADIGFNVRGEPVAHAVADQQRQIGMVEADHRHIELASGLQRSPGGQVGVADFDQVGFEPAQYIAPGARRTGKR